MVAPSRILGADEKRELSVPESRAAWRVDGSAGPIIIVEGYAGRPGWGTATPLARWDGRNTPAVCGGPSYGIPLADLGLAFRDSSD